MIKSVRIISLLILYFVSSSSGDLLQAQEFDPAIKHQIQSALKSRYGQDYDPYFYSLDSLIGTIWSYPGGYEITDPYGTLQGKMIFFASPTLAEKSIDEIQEERKVVGFFENGQITWDTGPLMPDAAGNELYGTMDLNNDGQVELLFPVRSFDLRYPTNYLWIISWDGTRGRILNDIDPETGKSVIRSTGRLFEFFDYEGDGVMEIRAFWDKEDALMPDTLMEVRPCVTYSWNGILYGMWPNTPQIRCREFLPMNRLTATVKCEVRREQNDSLVYNYTWSNHATSKQMIQRIWFEGINPDAEQYGPRGWVHAKVSPIRGRYWVLSDWYKLHMIKPGRTQSGFGLRDTQIPTIIKYYVQGHAPSPTTEPDEPDLTPEDSRRDLMNNAVVGYTIGPMDPAIVLTPPAFLDTLISYTRQAFALGWIKNRDIVQDLNAELNDAKRQLRCNNRRAAKDILRDFVDEVEDLFEEEDQRSDPEDVSQGDRQITSEAYALLKFNAEYLISKL